MNASTYDKSRRPDRAAPGLQRVREERRVAQLLAVPVGVVTVSVGGLYLVWLLAGQYARRG